MDTLFAFFIAMLLMMFFVRRYVKTLAGPKSRAAPASGPSAPQPAGSAVSCPRCGKSIGGDSSFCSGCGAPLALWIVHRAAVRAAPANGSTQGEKAQPKPVINATLCIGCGSCVDECPETGALALVSGKAILAHPDRCTGHARCVEVCPTSAITLSFGSKLQTMRAPLVKETFETNLPGVYIVGELSGMGLIKTAINEGRLAMDSIRQKLEEAGEWTPPVVDHYHSQPVPGGNLGEDRPYDVIVVGAGPAGLSASLSAVQWGLRYLTLEQGEVAATIRNYPRHKFLMAEPIEMPLYGNLYIGDGTKESLLQVWEAILANTGVKIRTQERVESVHREGGLLRVRTVKGEYLTKTVVLALGKRGTPRQLGVPGEGLGKVAYRLIEADSYSNEDLLVVGGGDSAIEAALALSKASRNRVTLSYRGKTFDRARERNRNLLLEAEWHGRIRILRGSHVKEILPDSVKLDVEGQETQLPNHYVFIVIGGEPPEAFLRKIGVEIVEKVISSEGAYELA